MELRLNYTGNRTEIRSGPELLRRTFTRFFSVQHTYDMWMLTCKAVFLYHKKPFNNRTVKMDMKTDEISVPSVLFPTILGL